MREDVHRDVRHLFVSPHPDDIPLSIGGTAAFLSARERCLQVTVFSAAPGEGPFSSFAADQHIAGGFDADDATGYWEVRRREDEAAARVLRLDYLSFDYEDAIYRGYETRAQLRGSPHDADLAPMPIT